MKLILKRMLVISPFLNKVRNKINLFRLILSDYKRYNEYNFLSSNEQTENNLRARITFYYHSIEKGLSNNNMRLGFGKRAFNELFKAMGEYKNKGYSLTDTRYQTALSTIEEYIKFHDENNFDISKLKEKAELYLNSNNINIGGVKTITKKEKELAKHDNFEVLSKNRVSVRNFSKELVDSKLIEDAIEIAMKTPSVCNRQPWKVYIVKNKEKKTEILKNQNGLNGFGENLDTLLVITTNNEFFAGPNERNQIYIDGGLFSMSLLYALEYKGLATCTLNAALEKQNMINIRKIISIPQNENIVLFIAVGNFPEKFSVPKSYRDSHKHIIEYK